MNRNNLGPGRGTVRAPSPPLPRKPAATADGEDFVALIAEEIAFGIGRAVSYWLGRVECQLVEPSRTPAERISAIEQILLEFKDGRG